MQKLLCVLGLLVLVSCGSEQTTPRNDPPPVITDPGDDSKVNVHFFGATWCTPCKKLFPNVYNGLQQDLGKDAERVVGRLYVVDAESQTSAAKYASVLKLPYQALPDEQWDAYYTVFDEDLPGLLPAIVVYDDKNTIIKKFSVHDASNKFDHTDVINTIKAQLTK